MDFFESIANQVKMALHQSISVGILVSSLGMAGMSLSINSSKSCNYNNMVEKQSLSLECILGCLNLNYGILATKLTLLPLGADMNASVYKAEAPDGQSDFVKLKRGHRYDMSVAILALLQASGIQQIIPPIKTTSGELTQHINDFTLTVYPFVHGLNGFCYNLTDEQWTVLGKVLRQVHEFDVLPSVKDLIRKETYSDKWRTAVRSLYPHIDGSLDGDEAAFATAGFYGRAQGDYSSSSKSR